MKIEVYIKRSNSFEKFLYEYEDSSETVAGMLKNINLSDEIINADGKVTRPIDWNSSCLQKRCGACAMVINGRPGLACDSFLRDYKKLTLEPLKKFPLIADLRTDRSVLQKNLKDMELYRDKKESSDEDEDDLYDASRCLLCGLCLEVCPNWHIESSFFGAAAAVSYYKKISGGGASKNYEKHFYGGCGKSLACRNICPAGINIDDLLVKSNRSVIWKRGH